MSWLVVTTCEIRVRRTYCVDAMTEEEAKRKVDQSEAGDFDETDCETLSERIVSVEPNV